MNIFHFQKPFNCSDSRSLFNPFILILVYIIWLFLRSGFASGTRLTFFIPVSLQNPFELITPAILLLFGVLSMLQIHCKRELFPFIIGSLLSVSLLLLSFLSNISSYNFALKFIMGYMHFLFLIPFIIFTSTHWDTKKAIKSIAVLVCIMIMFQFFLNLLWFLHISPFPNFRRAIPGNVDWAYGTLNNTDEAASLGCILIIASAFSIISARKRLSSKQKHIFWLLMAAGIFQVLWADSKLTIGTVFISLLICLLFVSKLNLSYKLLLIISISILIPAGVWTYAYVMVKTRVTWSTTDAFIARNRELIDKAFRYNPKVNTFNNISKGLPEDVIFPTLGGGPGVTSSHFAVKEQLPLARKYVGVLHNGLFNESLHIMNTALLLPDTGLNAIYGDLGICGIICFYGIHLYLLLKIILNYRKGFFSGDPVIEIIALTFIVIGFHYLLHSLIDDILYIGVRPALFWIFGLLLASKPNQTFHKAKADKLLVNTL